jgi:thiamine biosynthesis lipoprotein
VSLPLRYYAVLLTVLSACSDEQRLPEYELSGSTMGTTYSVKLIAPGEDVDRDRLRTRIDETLAAVDGLTSTWRDDSELSQFNANPSTDWIEVSAELCATIETALAVSRQSDGAFDVTVGPLVNLWGFGPDGQRREPPDDAALDAVMTNVGYEGITTRCDAPAVRKRSGGMYIDLSGWAKGYGVDRLAAVLDDYRLKDYLVEIGGELRVRGRNAEGKKWAIAIEAPSTTTRRPHSVLRLTDTSVATSGDYRNYFDHDGKRYSHTIDARTGRPVTHDLAAVTVISDTAAYADAMATALLVLGPDAGLTLAEDLGIAGYFLVRNQAGIKELTTSSFDLLRN